VTDLISFRKHIQTYSQIETRNWPPQLMWRQKYELLRIHQCILSSISIQWAWKG